MLRRPSQLRRLAPCAALTIAAHAAVLALPAKPVWSARGNERAHVGALEVRVLPVAAPAQTVSPMDPWAAPRDVVEARVEAVLPTATRTTTARPAPAALHEPASVTANASAPALARDPSPVAHAADGAPVAPDASVVPHGDDAWGWSRAATEDDAFLARSLLTLGPQPLAPVIVPVPAWVRAGDLYRGELTLFIDEFGAVVRVQSEADDWPDELLAVARQAFMAARFAPGELTDIGAVKSRIRIEVVFDGGASPDMPGL